MLQTINSPSLLDFKQGQVGTDVATEQERSLQLRSAMQRKQQRETVPPPPSLSLDPEISVSAEAGVGSEAQHPLMATKLQSKA